MEVGNSRSTHFLWTRWHALGNTIQRKLIMCVLNIGNAKSAAAQLPNLSTNKRCWYTSTKAFVNCDSYSTLSIWSRPPFPSAFQQPFHILYMIYSKYRCARTLCPCSTKHHPCYYILWERDLTPVSFILFRVLAMVVSLLLQAAAWW